MQTLATLFLLSVPATSGDELRYIPAERAETRYSFTETTDLRMTFLRNVMSGQVTERTDFHPNYRQQTSRRWRDKIVRVAGGRDVEFVREVEQAAEEFTLQIQERGKDVTGHAVSAAGVEGARVLFDWVESGEAYVSRLGDTDCTPDVSPAWLNDLSADTTCQAFLPPSSLEKPSPGSTWCVDASAMAELLAPGGKMSALYGPLEGAENPDLLALYGSLSAARLAEEIDGSVMASWRSTLIQDGRRFAIIDLAFDLDLTARPTAWMREQSKAHALALMGQGTRNAKVDAGLKGTASILWDIEAGRMLRVTLQSDNTVHVAFDYAFSIGTTAVDGRYEFDLVGRTAIQLEARR